MIIRVLHEHKNKHISQLCTIAQVSRSGYYAWLKTADEPNKDENDYIHIKQLFEKGKKRWGFRTIQMKLKDYDIIMNHKKILRIMKKYHLYTVVRRINPYKMIMKKSQEHRTCENLLNREFKQTKPYMVFGTDITYIRYNYRFAYLSAVKDFDSGEIVAWNVSQHIDMRLVMDTIKDIRQNTRITSTDNIMIHSDQGFHYTNPQYITKVKQMNMIQSMSRKGNCIDNSPTESFFGHLKDEVNFKTCKTFNQVQSLLKEYMLYYNQHRHQWNKNKMTPVQYRDHLLTQS